MMIPNYPQTPISDGKGNITPEWQNTINQLLTELQLNLNNEGYKLPGLPTSSIDDLGVLPGTAAKTEGTMIYDSTTQEMKVYLNGAWRVVQVV